MRKRHAKITQGDVHDVRSNVDLDGLWEIWMVHKNACCDWLKHGKSLLNKSTVTTSPLSSFSLYVIKNLTKKLLACDHIRWNENTTSSEFEETLKHSCVNRTDSSLN